MSTHQIVINPGDRYNNYTVLRELPKVRTAKARYRLFECQCDCGSVVQLSMNVLRHKVNRQSCKHCVKKQIKPGDRFNRLTIIKEVDPISRTFENGERKEVYRRFECQCDCGNICVKQMDALTKGVMSCGCWVGELNSITRRTHGMKKTPEYKIWLGIKQRCHNPNDAGYVNYGGRGIKVCDRWLESFEDFYADMGPRPSSKHSIGRKDNDAGYSPENCRWETVYQQARNTRSNRFISLEGQTLCLIEWAEKYSFDYCRFNHAINGRLKDFKEMTEEQVLEYFIRHESTNQASGLTKNTHFG